MVKLSLFPTHVSHTGLGYIRSLWDIRSQTGKQQFNINRRQTTIWIRRYVIKIRIWLTRQGNGEDDSEKENNTLIILLSEKSHWIILIAFDCVLKVVSYLHNIRLHNCILLDRYLWETKIKPNKKSQTNKAEEEVGKDCCLVLLDLLNYIVWGIGHLHQRQEQQPLQIPDREWRPCLTEKKQPKTIRHSRLRM